MKQEDNTRKCIVTGEVLPKEKLLRFVVAGGVIVPDFAKKLSGKGIWLTCSAKHLQTAIEKKLFAKAAKHNVLPMPDLLSVTAEVLRQNGLHLLSLAKKANTLIVGLDKVLEALAKDKIAFAIEASDAGADGAAKLQAKLVAEKRIMVYNVEELEKALGKTNVAYVALKKGTMANTIYNELKKYELFINSQA